MKCPLMDLCAKACPDCEDIGDFFLYEDPDREARKQAREYCFQVKEKDSEFSTTIVCTCFTEKRKKRK